MEHFSMPIQAMQDNATISPMTVDILHLLGCKSVFDSYVVYTQRFHNLRTRIPSAIEELDQYFGSGNVNQKLDLSGNGSTSETIVDLMLEQLATMRSGKSATALIVKERLSAWVKRPELLTEEISQWDFVRSQSVLGLLDKVIRDVVGRVDLTLPWEHWVLLANFTGYVRFKAYFDAWKKSLSQLEGLKQYYQKNMIEHVCKNLSKHQQKLLDDIWQGTDSDYALVHPGIACVELGIYKQSHWHQKRIRLTLEEIRRRMEWCILANDAQVAQQLIGLQFPMVTDELAKYACDFLESHGHHPLFRLLNHHFSQTQDIKLRVYALYHGIGNIPTWTVQQLAKKFGVADERVRYYLSKALESLPDAYAQRAWEVYPLLKRPFLEPQDPAVQHMFRAEGLDLNWNSICKLIEATRLYTLEQVNETQVLIRKHIYSQINIGQFILSLKEFDHNPRVVKPINLQSLSHPDSEVYEVLQYLVSCYPELVISSTRQVFKGSVEVQFLDQVLDILRRSNRPMTIDEMLQASTVAGKCTTVSEQTIKQIRKLPGMIYDRMKATFTLQTSHANFSQELLDFLTEYLSRFNQPTHMSNIVRAVKDRFGTVPKMSLVYVLHSFFIPYHNQMYGLKDYPYAKRFEPKVNNKQAVQQEMIKSLYTFIEENHRLPFHDGRTSERRLYSWMHKVILGRTLLSATEANSFSELQRMIEERHYPKNNKELEYYEYCQYIQIHLNQRKRMEDLSGSFKAWFIQAVERMKDCTDPRYYYLKEIEKFLPDGKTLEEACKTLKQKMR